jgi:exopolysaccharide biosynthesis WecB/TagA/CpsF family protein
MTISPSGGVVRLFGLPIGRWTEGELTEAVCDAARGKHPLFVTYLNAHNVNVSARDSRYVATLARADVVYADGMSVVWASRLLAGRGLPERVNAGDFFPAFCRACAGRGLSLYLLGSEPRVSSRCANRLCSTVPGLRIAGATDGFWGRGGEFESEERLIESIRRAGPDILLVGLGVPRQELWAERHAADLGVPVIWCVGALFEYYGGRRARAPVWMRRLGLEWAFRLALEPRRLARRYLLGNAEFLWRVAREYALARRGAHRP